MKSESVYIYDYIYIYIYMHIYTCHIYPYCDITLKMTTVINNLLQLSIFFHDMFFMIFMIFIRKFENIYNIINISKYS